MDNHKGAFAFWESLGIRDATCIHVDAHLDVSNFQVPEPGELEHPELNCGSFLYPAMKDGLISHLIWLLPPRLYGEKPFLDWARRELQNWMWLTVDEYRSLHLVEGRVEGMLAGARLTLCTLEHLPAFENPLIDIDIDYFFAPDDSVWQSPLELCDRMQGDVVTIATSIEGGYTPQQHRYIGELCRLALTGRRDEAARWWDALQRGDVPVEAPAWCRAAHLARRGQWDEAAAIDDDYRRKPIDVAGYHFQRGRWAEMDPWLDDTDTAQYMRGLKLWRQQDPAGAEQCWRPLTQRAMASGLLGGHLYDLIGKVCMEQQRWADARVAFMAATRCVPELASLWRQLGDAQARLSEADAAARSWRRALALAPDHLPNLPVRLTLAQHYLAAGQLSLARTELRHVAIQDDGALAAKARLLSMELEARRG